MVYSGYMLCVCVPGMDGMSICHHSKLILEVWEYVSKSQKSLDYTDVQCLHNQTAISPCSSTPLHRSLLPLWHLFSHPLRTLTIFYRRLTFPCSPFLYLLTYRRNSKIISRTLTPLCRPSKPLFHPSAPDHFPLTPLCHLLTPPLRPFNAFQSPFNASPSPFDAFYSTFDGGLMPPCRTSSLPFNASSLQCKYF